MGISLNFQSFKFFENPLFVTFEFIIVKTLKKSQLKVPAGSGKFLYRANLPSPTVFGLYSGPYDGRPHLAIFLKNVIFFVCENLHIYGRNQSTMNIDIAILS